MWTKWLHNPWCLVDPQCGDKIKLATQDLPSWRPTCGENGCIIPAVLGAHKWLHDECLLREPKRGDKIKVAT